MFKKVKTAALFIVTFVFSTSNMAQENTRQSTLSKSEKAEIVQALSQVMIDEYIYLDKAKQVKSILLKQLKQGKFDGIADKRALTKALTTSVMAVINDKHFRVIVPRRRNNEQNSDFINAHINALTQFRRGVFKTLKC